MGSLFHQGFQTPMVHAGNLRSVTALYYIPRLNAGTGELFQDHINTHTHVYTYTCIYTHIFIYTHICIYTHACLPAKLLQSHPTLQPPVVHRAPPLSMGFSRQEYWSGLLYPPPGDLPDPRIKPSSSVAPALQERVLYH